MRLRILPLLVLVALMVFAVRFGETFTSVKNFDAQALAEEKKAEAEVKPEAKTEAEPAPAAATKEAEKPAPEKTATTPPALPEVAAAAGAAKPAGAEAAPAAKPALTLPEVWTSPTDEAMDTSVERENLLRDLSKRREGLDKREKELAQREAVLNAAQKQIDAKMAEMAKLKTQLETLLGQQTEQDASQTKSLVKIYEGMKPKDAAAIFNQLEMDLLVNVVSNMSELRASPILAQMETAKARDLTMRLAALKKLPEAPKPVTSPPLNQNLGEAAYVPGIDGAAAPTQQQ